MADLIIVPNFEIRSAVGVDPAVSTFKVRGLQMCLGIANSF